MKKVSKNKRNPKGSQKISDFFKKATNVSQVDRLEKCIVVSDSEDELFLNKPCCSKTFKNEKENISVVINGHTRVSEENFSPNHLAKKRKTEELNTDFLIENSPKISPSTSEYKRKPIISVKGPEKLLCTQALNAQLTPEKQVISEDNFNISSAKAINGDNTEYLKKTSPSKRLKGKARRMSGSSPTKLFQRSPKLNEFKTQIIDSYIQITPSKSNLIICSPNKIKNSDSKKQSSILNYMSPTPSPKSVQIQNRNETTPTRITQPVQVFTSTSPSINKVKTKLNFNDDTQMKLYGFDVDDSWDNMIKDIPEFKLDLTEFHHCKIININPFPNKNVLTLTSTKTGEQAICNLEGFWIHSILSIGDIVSVQAKKVDVDWVVNNDYGCLVFEPDLLISTTTVVNSLWCNRRSILSEKFRGFEPGNEAMLIGILVHNLLQSVLTQKINNREAIKTYIEKLICGPNILRTLYEYNLTVDHIKTTLYKFIPNIEEFLNLYVEDVKVNHTKVYKKDNWKGSIVNIEDIEENIWCPELGLKGKVDVSIKTNFSMMPLEVKTGRATVSLEHRGQVIMYTMMMNKLGYSVPSGLLFYIREGVLREIPTTQKEKRDLMLLRNELAYYLTRNSQFLDNSNEKIYPGELPQPINHSSCQKCPYNILCTSFLTYNKENLSSYKVLKDIQNELLQNVSQSHLHYFMKWVSLLSLESNSDTSSKNLREIYTLSPVQREVNGRCITYLKVAMVEECNNLFEHTFERNKKNVDDSFFSKGIMEGNYVIVSTDERPAVSSGFVTNITVKSISVSLERDLNKKYSNNLFHIDSYDSNTIQTYNLSNLSMLLEMTPRAKELRRIIIDKGPPIYKTTLPKLIGITGKSILQRLNIVQQRAVLKAIAAEDYFLIKGMPGTGKTTTIVALIQLLHELNKSVLITSHTHSAVDNVCLKLINYNIKVLRLGSLAKIDSRLIPYSEHHITKSCSTPEDFEKIYNEAQIIAVTCLGSGHPLLSKRMMDICVVDESTQVLQCSVIKPLYSANTFILIGDQDQLPPVVRDKKALEMGLSESLFERLYTKESSIALNLNYRMNSVITALANDFTYNGELLVGNDDIGKAVIQLPNKELLNSYKDTWILHALDDTLDKAVQVIDTGPVWKLKHNVVWKINHIMNTKEKNTFKEDMYINIYEAAIVVNLVRVLLIAEVNPNDIGIIVTYRSQVTQLSNLLKSENIHVNTVDQFQGQDKNVIIFSCVQSRDVSMSKFGINKFELLEDRRRINVAITRAKHKLIILGDLETLYKYSTFTKLFKHIKNETIRLAEYPGFDWNSVLTL